MITFLLRSVPTDPTTTTTIPPTTTTVIGELETWYTGSAFAGGVVVGLILLITLLLRVPTEGGE